MITAQKAYIKTKYVDQLKKAKEQIIKSFHKHYQETKELLCQKKKNMC